MTGPSGPADPGGGRSGPIRSPGEVWVPHAERVELVSGGERGPMERLDDGWWRPVRPLRPSDDYAFSVDGGPGRPDPRSRWQPDGPEGPSRVDDPDAFSWSDDRWTGFHLPSAVLYELHVGTFSAAGTFDGAIDHLDELVELGVTAIEIMPVAEFPGRWGWGYDGVDLYAPHHAYGGPAGLRRLVDASHQRGLGVVLDVVYNHLGPSGNHLGAFGPYFTDRYRTPWGDALNVDGPDSDEVRRFVIDNACGWVAEFGIDGLRLDATHAIIDTSAVHLLEELTAEVGATARRLGRHVAIMAEDDRRDPLLLRSPEAGGYGMDGLWNDDVHHGLHVALTHERDGYYEDYVGLADLARALRRGFVYDGRWSAHRRRRVGRPLGGLGADRLIASLQNHDQIGNRATGDRINATVGQARHRVGAGLLLTAPFVPLLFQGEEWGASTPFPFFCDHTDAKLAAAVRRGRRQEFAAFGWAPDEVPDPGDPATFASAKLDRTEQDLPEHRQTLDWYRELLRLRRERPEVRDPDFAATTVRNDEHAIVIERGSLAVVANLGSEPIGVDVGGRADLLAVTGDADVTATTLTVAPDSLAVVSD